MTRRRQTSRTIPDHAPRRIDEDLEVYGVIAEIARGGTSTVYLGHHLATGERVAIKALDSFYVGNSEMVHRLLGEHELAQRAHHPGLLEVRCADQTAHGIPYVVMEYLDGESLAAMVDRTALPFGSAASPGEAGLGGRTALPIGSIIAIAAQIASAMAALHAGGVIHCDLKPDNIFVLYQPGPGGWPRVKVIDYGVARLTDELPQPHGTVVGTPAFMAPEQWHGAPTAGSDVYALGCVLYELVTGEPLFSGALPQLMKAHCERLPARPSLRHPDLDPELEQLLLRALAKDAAARPTMAEIDATLSGLSERTPATVAPAAALPAVALRPSALTPPPRPLAAARSRMRDTFGDVPEGYARRLEAHG